jgi:signal-transduction protein with cAMP-binding, CBS, and nucleotidyltransferase domain
MKQEPYIKVAEVMTRDLQKIDSMASVREAMEKMAREKVSSLIVERRDERDEYGMIVVTDIARRVVAQNLSFDRVQVYEVMSKPVVHVDPEMDLRYAIRLLVRFGLSRALVIENGRQIQGVVTLRDMVLRYAKLEETEKAP